MTIKEFVLAMYFLSMLLIAADIIWDTLRIGLDDSSWQDILHTVYAICHIVISLGIADYLVESSK